MNLYNCELLYQILSIYVNYQLNNNSPIAFGDTRAMLFIPDDIAGQYNNILQQRAIPEAN